MKWAILRSFRATLVTLPDCIGGGTWQHILAMVTLAICNAFSKYRHSNPIAANTQAIHYCYNPDDIILFFKKSRQTFCIIQRGAITLRKWLVSLGQQKWICNIWVNLWMYHQNINLGTAINRALQVNSSACLLPPMCPFLVFNISCWKDIFFKPVDQ